MEHIVLFVTTASRAEAEKLGRTLVEENLVACVNIIEPVHSIFSWKNDICQEQEALLIMKSIKDRQNSIIARVKHLHSYEVPEIIALPIVGGSEDYLNWVTEETKI